MTKQAHGVIFLTQNVEITILGQRYVVKSEQDEAELREVARYVDAKLGELIRGGKTTSLGVVVIGALNIANEYHLFRRQMEDALQQLEERSNRLMELLEQRSGCG